VHIDSLAELAGSSRTAERRGFESAWAALVGTIVVGLLAVAAQNGTKGLVVIGGGLIGLSALVVLAKAPGLPERVLLLAMAVTLSISIKFHPVFRPDHLGGAIGLRVSITDLMMGGLVLLALGPALRRGWARVRADGALAVAASAYLVWAVASTLASADRTLGWFQVSAVVQAMVVGLFVASRHWAWQPRRVFVSGLLAALLLQSGIAILQSMRPGLVTLQFLGAAEYAEDTGDAIPVVDVGATTIAGQAAYRPTGLLIHPNVLAAYFVLTLPLALAVALTARTRWERALASAAAVGTTAALYLSLSRSGWVGMATALTIGAALAWRWRALTLTRTVRLTIAVAGLALILGIAWKADRIYLRLTETAGAAIDFRREYALTAWQMVTDHPLLGVGLNTFTDHAVQYDASGTSRLKAFPVHNAYLLELAETGFPGGLAFSAMVLAMIAAAFRAARQSTGETRVLVLALAAGIAGFWMTQLSDYLYRIPIMTSLVWAHAGLAIGLARAEPTS
jgi:putative inorganic carbon (hco3(-)) transporter